jgi:hypothetical protein
VRAAFAVKAALASLLEASAAGRYQVAGIPKRKLDAEKLLSMPLVTVYYEQGSFPKGSSSINGPYQHEATLRVDIVTAAEAEMDLAVLQDKNSTPEEIAAALAARTDAETVADLRSDETAALLFDIIMRPQNRSFGLEDDPGRWITAYTKGKPQTTGALVVLAGYFTLTYQVPEYTTEEEGVPGTILRHEINTTPDTAGDTEEGVVVDAPV